MEQIERERALIKFRNGTNQLIVATEDEKEDDVIELVQDQESEQILVLWDVSQQANYKLKEAIHLEPAIARDLQIHDQIFHQMYDLSQALEILESWP